MVRLNNKKGQSTVEYIVLVTAVIAVIIAFATSNNGGLRGKLGNTYNQLGDNWTNKARTLADSQVTNSTASSPAPTVNVDLEGAFK